MGCIRRLVRSTRKRTIDSAELYTTGAVRETVLPCCRFTGIFHFLTADLHLAFVKLSNVILVPSVSLPPARSLAPGGWEKREPGNEVVAAPAHRFHEPLI